MKKLLLTVVLLLVLSSDCFAFDDWSKLDVAFETAYVIVTVIDWGQTLDIAKRPNQYSEINPFLGKHPSVDLVNTFIPISIAGHILISALIPNDCEIFSMKCRTLWQSVTLGAESYMVVNNFNIGLRMNF